MKMLVGDALEDIRRNVTTFKNGYKKWAFVRKASIIQTI